MIPGAAAGVASDMLYLYGWIPPPLLLFDAYSHCLSLRFIYRSTAILQMRVNLQSNGTSTAHMSRAQYPQVNVCAIRGYRSGLSAYRRESCG